MRIPLGAIITISALTLAGCSSKGLRTLDPIGPGPDEFLVLPNKPLTAPKDYDVLPAPTPGGTNLVDQNPTADAVVALGGRASALEANGVPAADGNLVAQASRYGVAPNTRTALAQEDEEFRRRKAKWSRIKLFPVDRYQQVYSKQALDPFVENERFRRAGLPTPSAPPKQ